MNYIVLFLYYLRVTPFKFFVWLLFQILGLIVVIRASGTDTATIYEPLARALLHGGTASKWISGLEPGFKFVLGILVTITGSDLWGVRVIGILFIGLLLYFISRADRVELLFMLAFFVPIFFYQYGMNAIRAGLALGVFLLAWQYLRRNLPIGFWILALIAALFHYSIFLPIVLVWVFELKFTNPRSWAYLTFGILVFATVGWMKHEYLLSKFFLYYNFGSPSSLSGLSRSLLIALLLLASLPSSFSLKEKALIFFVFFPLTIGFQLLSFYSYAGLRFLDLVLFSLPLVLIRVYDRRAMRLDKFFVMALLLVGFLGAAAVYRNFLTDYNGQLTGTTSPFLPYQTVFNRTR